MAIPITNHSGTAELGDIVTAAYDRVSNFALRPQLVFAMVSQVKPTRQSHPGSSVGFPFFGDLAAATTALTEDAEIAGATMSDSLVTVTLVEYGNAVETTAKVRGTSFVSVDTAAANVIGYNAGLSYDTLARNVLEDDSTIASADRKQFIGQSAEASITATDTITTTSIKKAVAQLRGDDAPTIGGRYVGYIHPDVSFDLREEGAAFTTDEGTTRTPGLTSPGFGLWNYLAANAEGGGARIWDGMIGSFAGVDFIETSRPSVNTDGGSGNVDTYTTTIVGQQALACAFSSTVSAATPQTVIGPVRDVLRRFVPVGWYWLGGFGEFREECRHLIISASSLGANT